MSAAEFQLVGGPIDGRRISLRRRSKFLWIDVRAGGKCYLAPGRERVLYRRSTWREGLGRVRDGYLFAGHTHAACETCGAIVGVNPEAACTLCGGDLAKHPAAS